MGLAFHGEAFWHLLVAAYEGCRISEAHPTIDQQLCTDRKRCLIRGEKHDSIRDLTWLSEPSRWDLLDERSLLLL
jgi:hypothetical protein